MRISSAIILAAAALAVNAAQPVAVVTVDAPMWGGTFEDFCRLISGHSDIFYGTNREVLL